MAMARIGILASGGGSNFQAIIDAVESGHIPDSEIVLIITDKKGAYALERAKKHSIESLHLDPKNHGSRQEYDGRIAQEMKKRKADVICMAGYMRVITSELLDAFPQKILNIHPALLPSFAGLHGQKQALDYGVKVSGATVHFADDKVDHGPIICQEAVPVKQEDTEQTLSERILAAEHRIYPKAIKWFVEKRLSISGRKVLIRESGR